MQDNLHPIPEQKPRNIWMLQLGCCSEYKVPGQEG